MNRAAHVAQVVHAFPTIAVCEILAAVFKAGDTVFVEKFLCVCVVELLEDGLAMFVMDSHIRSSFQLTSWVNENEAGTRNQRFARGGSL